MVTCEIQTWRAVALDAPNAMNETTGLAISKCFRSPVALS